MHRSFDGFNFILPYKIIHIEVGQPALSTKCNSRPHGMAGHTERFDANSANSRRIGDNSDDRSVEFHLFRMKNHRDIDRPYLNIGDIILDGYYKGPVILHRKVPRGAACPIHTKKRRRPVPPGNFNCYWDFWELGFSIMGISMNATFRKISTKSTKDKKIRNP
uniref:Uncharacterized protein n=1 Tax=Romanomermis culicivorax TaxID=13658 RepID=A0A915IRL2_ROMCU